MKNQDPDVYIGSPSISPDGKLFAYIADIEDKVKGTSESYLRVLEYANGVLGKKILEQRLNFYHLTWSPDSRSVIVSDFSDPRGDLLRIEVADGRTTKVSDFSSNAYCRAVVWSKDNKRLLMLRTTGSDALKVITDLSLK